MEYDVTLKTSELPDSVDRGQDIGDHGRALMSLLAERGSASAEWGEVVAWGAARGVDLAPLLIQLDSQGLVEIIEPSKEGRICQLTREGQEFLGLRSRATPGA